VDNIHLADDGKIHHVIVRIAPRPAVETIVKPKLLSGTNGSAPAPSNLAPSLPS